MSIVGFLKEVTIKVGLERINTRGTLYRHREIVPWLDNATTKIVFTNITTPLWRLDSIW